MSTQPPLSAQEPSQADLREYLSLLWRRKWIVLACIVGVVYMIQGKPKGLKMVGISLAMIVFWNFVNVLIQHGGK